MANNYLEQLVAEWYEYHGYFIRQNVLVGKRPKGGYEGELDIVAFHPESKHLAHIEPTMDAHSWAKREERFEKSLRLVENTYLNSLRVWKFQIILSKYAY